MRRRDDTVLLLLFWSQGAAQGVILIDIPAALFPGTATRREMSRVVADLPVINPHFTGSPSSRFTWVATLDVSVGMPTFDGIVKYDVTAPEGHDAAEASFKFGERCFAGEAVFVPRYEEPERCDGGWPLRCSCLLYCCSEGCCLHVVRIDCHLTSLCTVDDVVLICHAVPCVL